jgi:hypothetical protein
MREESRLEAVLGTHGRSGEQFNAWDAAYGPAGADGYPREMWDKRTGIIDHAVIAAMRARGFDLTAYLQRNWARIGPALTGKLHVDVGDDDDYFLNLAVYRLQAFLASTTRPAARAVFRYGRPMKPHGWQAAPTIEYLREMARRATFTPQRSGGVGAAQRSPTITSNQPSHRSAAEVLAKRSAAKAEVLAQRSEAKAEVVSEAKAANDRGVSCVSNIIIPDEENYASQTRQRDRGLRIGCRDSGSRSSSSANRSTDRAVANRHHRDARASDQHQDGRTDRSVRTRHSAAVSGR